MKLFAHGPKGPFSPMTPEDLLALEEGCLCCGSPRVLAAPEGGYFCVQCGTRYNPTSAVAHE